MELREVLNTPGLSLLERLAMAEQHGYRTRVVHDGPTVTHDPETGEAVRVWLTAAEAIHDGVVYGSGIVCAQDASEMVKAANNTMARFAALEKMAEAFS